MLWRLLEVFEPIENFAEIRVGRHVVQQVDVTVRDRQLEPVSQALLFQALERTEVIRGFPSVVTQQVFGFDHLTGRAEKLWVHAVDPARL